MRLTAHLPEALLEPALDAAPELVTPAGTALVFSVTPTDWQVWAP